MGVKSLVQGLQHRLRLLQYVLQLRTPGNSHKIIDLSLGVVRNTPFRRPSCQAREEKRKFSPTATSLRRRRQRSRT